MKNIGSTDKLVRIYAGILLLFVLFFVPGNLRFIGLLGIVLLGTAFIGTCPLYLPFKINTNKGTDKKVGHL